MKYERKLTFIKALAELDKLINIRNELANKLQKKFEELDINQKELIILDLVEAASSHEAFIEPIINIKSLNIGEIINLINNRITNNLNFLKEIDDRCYTLLKILLKLKRLDINCSIDFIRRLHTLIQELFSQNIIWNYWNNPNNPNYQNHIVNYLFRNKSLVDLMAIHTINIYRQEKDKSENSNTLQQIRNFEKFIISVYLRMAQKIEETRNTLAPLSIISIILDLSAEVQPMANFGNINLKEVYGAVVNYKKLDSTLTEYLSLLYNTALIYGFLDELEQQWSHISDGYKSFILELILDEAFYTDKMLVDYYILLSRNIHEKYENIILHKNKKDKFWYKNIVIDNLTRKENNKLSIIHKETIRFLLSDILNKEWLREDDITQKVKEFIKKHISKIFEEDYIYSMLELLVTSKQRLDVDYTSDNFGQKILENFINVNDNNSHILEFLFANAEYILKKKDILRLIRKIIEELSKELSKTQEDHIKLLGEARHLINNIDIDLIERVFDKLIDIKDNATPYKLFLLIIEENKQTLNNEFIKDIKDKLNNIKEHSNDEETIKTIDAILEHLEDSSNAHQQS
ncbi:hypothetical protein G4V39_02260 [Thermosulfuriphilus ammonigenes]|uniref:Uncharacterized protein n=1 Tax=Thermosulfuriphilus ammonigenes TaxID=1936021 RepID=A0A6G7PU11_9BACT|nr:hypothetical protein [Thermosulfuriphilus ammonigenes]MBA2848695.1 hypothetical protein [Thermosulfuriphilus ammonigenes]QIJ71169.1 hypothetical protein G4V39_02260 [Thermosulfuriphilus ammonigenes]